MFAREPLCPFTHSHSHTLLLMSYNRVFLFTIQINAENELFKEGKASFYEELNPNSDLPKDVFEKEKEGYIDAASKGRGYIIADESDFSTHPELEKLYRLADRQSIPASYDATANGD
jgi:hypothetical protein